MLRTLFTGACGLVALAAGLAAFSACYDVSEPSYGNANGLSVSNLPGEAGSAAATCDSTSLKFDSGSCPSFKNDIFPYMQGPWACVSGGCHGGNTAPKMDPENAGPTLAALRVATVAGRNYIPSAAAASAGGDLSSTTSMLCNVQGSCGSKMPKAPGVDLTSTEQCIVQAWINCGSPQ